MKGKYLIIAGFMLIAMVLILSACQPAAPQATPCPTAGPIPTAPACPEAPACPTAEACPAPVVASVPNQDAWANSPHNKADAEAFNHWNSGNPAEIPTSCATCHSTAGYQDFLGADGSAVGVVDKAVPAPAGTLQCTTCHNSAAQALTAVKFPYTYTGEDGKPVQKEITGLGPEARCMVCHQGRASKSTVDAQIAKFNVTDVDAVVQPLKDGEKTTPFGFINIHYFAAAATLYGTEVKGGYEYEGKMYDSKHDHVPGYATCVGCHDPHSLQIKIDKCQMCHTDVKTVEDLKNVREPSSMMDYDGDGNTTEGMFFEIQGLQEKLYAAIQAYAKDVAGKGIVYDAAAYPYFLLDANGDGKPDQNDKGANIGYDSWTARLLKAAYNYQVSVKDPGMFAHGNKYIVQLLYDSIEDLNTKLATPVDLSTARRDDAGHFAGNTEPFRHWDGEGGVVPGACAKCHSATGLPQFLAEGANISNPASNGFQCSTCHDEANWPNRYAVSTVTFPSGASVGFGAKDDSGKQAANDSNLCILCHQGRESTTSVNKAVGALKPDEVGPKLGFRNVHYFAAGATIFGGEVQGMYQYKGKEYLGRSVHPVIECKACHDVHKLNVKLDTCAACHGEVKDPRTIRFSTDTTDWDGDGNKTEGVDGEIATMRDKLYAALQAYAETKAGTPIVYSPVAYPYFFADANKDGKPDVDDKGATVRYSTWSPRLLEAAYNLQYSYKDPGAFVHNPKYVMQVLYDSIQDVGGSVAGMTRP